MEFVWNAWIYRKCLLSLYYKKMTLSHAKLDSSNVNIDTHWLCQIKLLYVNAAIFTISQQLGTTENYQIAM